MGYAVGAGEHKTDMTRFVLLALGLALALAVSGAQAQTTDPDRPLQSLRPSQSPCGPSSQSVRVCNDDFRSCNSVCNAEALDPSSDIAGCGLRCCNQLKACLSIRGCASLSLNCF
jgi:hypothetical protein